tara:strand:+ start:472 stop:678 length:207 start_codon:yes stop_codon:yes gene_type:complete
MNKKQELSRKSGQGPSSIPNTIDYSLHKKINIVTLITLRTNYYKLVHNGKKNFTKGKRDRDMPHPQQQ